MTLRTRVEYAEMMGARSTTRGRALLGSLVVAGFIVAACTGDDDVFRAAPNAYYDASASDHVIPPPALADAATQTFFCGDAAGAPPRALVVSSDTPSELAAVNLETGNVDGRYWLDGGTGVSAAASNADPWVLDQTQDLVTRLDPRSPWKPLATWNVRSTDSAGDGLSATPVAVAQVSCTKAYVPRFGRNRIAIIDPSAASSDGVPTGFVDLGPYLLPGDTGTVDMTSAVWVPTKKRVYVLVGNVNRNVACAALQPAIFAIDPTTDAIVSLGGKGAGGSIQLAGIDPPLGSAMVYDPTFDRLLVVTGGCPTALPDGGAGPATRRLLEQVDLATGAVTTIADFAAEPRPTGLAFVDPQHAFVSFGSVALELDPSDGGIESRFTIGLDRVSDDARGNFVGARHIPGPDGGPGNVDLLAIPADGGTTLRAHDLFSAPARNAASLEPWPRR